MGLGAVLFALVTSQAFRLWIKGEHGEAGWGRGGILVVSALALGTGMAGVLADFYRVASHLERTPADSGAVVGAWLVRDAALLSVAILLALAGGLAWFLLTQWLMAVSGAHREILGLVGRTGRSTRHGGRRRWARSGATWASSAGRWRSPSWSWRPSRCGPSVRLFRPGAAGDLRTKAWLDSILFWGGFALIAGVLGTLLGIIVAAQSIEAAGGQVSPALAWGGIKVAMLSSAFGTLILALSSVVWFALQLRWRLLVAEESERAAAA